MEMWLVVIAFVTSAFLSFCLLLKARFTVDAIMKATYEGIDTFSIFGVHMSHLFTLAVMSAQQQ